MTRKDTNPTLRDCYTEILRNPGKVYVYLIKRSSGEPFYVGVGQKRRIGCHQTEAKNPEKRSHKLSIIRSDVVSYEIVGWFNDWRETAEEEVRLIALYGRRDNATGILTNMTDGGEGAPGARNREWTDEQRAATAERQRLLWEDPEYRERQIGAFKDAAKTPKRIEQISRAYKGKSHTPEARSRISAGNKGRRRTESELALQSAGKKQLWSDPAFRERMLAAQKAWRDRRAA